VAGYVVGKSSLGRRGLIIATATGVHPGFTGCLTLELTNVGEIPVAIQPGMRICQLFLHRVGGRASKNVDKSTLVGLRRPQLGLYKTDKVATRLADAYKIANNI
jgi:dCTP deaminase